MSQDIQWFEDDDRLIGHVEGEEEPRFDIVEDPVYGFLSLLDHGDLVRQGFSIAALQRRAEERRAGEARHAPE